MIGRIKFVGLLIFSSRKSLKSKFDVGNSKFQVRKYQEDHKWQ